MGRQGLSAAAVAASTVAHAFDIAGTRVALSLRRSARRSFALQVDQHGARVAAPLQASLQDIERFVRQHGDWLLEHLRRRPPPPPQLVLEEGTEFPLLGRVAQLRRGEGRRVRWLQMADGREQLEIPHAVDARRTVLRALQARALAWHRERVAAFCLRLGVPQPPVRLSQARTRWGSCSRASGIRLHWRLIHLPPALIDYVVAHEVAHLLEMNHSPRFWAVVERLYPDWRAARVELRAAASTLPVLGSDPDPAPPPFTGLED